MIHDFHERLNYSLAGRDEIFWDQVYRKAFPNLSHWELVDDPNQQKQGIDRRLFLTTYGGSFKTVLIDEKKRASVHNDILLEYASTMEYNTPGWIEKDLSIDFLAYAFMPISRVYLFSWPMLRRAWIKYGADWKKKYKSIEAKNAGYTTLCTPVPIKVLRRAVSTASIIDVSNEMRDIP